MPVDTWRYRVEGAKMALLAKERGAMPDNRTGNPEIGARLRRLRLAKGLTQDELGALLDPPADQTTISTYETGAVDVSTATVIQLTKILDSTAAFIYGETDNPLNADTRLRLLGIDPGNLGDLNDPRLEGLVADLAELLSSRRLSPSGQGGPGISGDEPSTASAG
jgi:transcriptional regulator with XRE-family HTH domain